MSMSKKDYQAIARVLHGQAPGFITPAERLATGDVHVPGFQMWQRIVEDMAAVLAADNPRFDHARFVEACETGRTKGMPR